MSEIIVFDLPAPGAGEVPAVEVNWYQSVDGTTWGAQPVDTVLVADLPQDPDTLLYTWESALADPAKWHMLKTESGSGIIGEHGIVIQPRGMQAIRREVNNHGQPLLDKNDNPHANVKITWRLVKGGAPASAFDALTGEYHTAEAKESFTDEHGLYSVRLWPTSRGAAGLKYRRQIHLPKERPVDFSLPAGDLSPIKWSALT